MINSDKLIVEGLSIAKAMTKIDETLSEIINSLIDLVVKFGIINVDFADFRSIITRIW